MERQTTTTGRTVSLSTLQIICCCCFVFHSVRLSKTGRLVLHLTGGDSYHHPGDKTHTGYVYAHFLVGNNEKKMRNEIYLPHLYAFGLCAPFAVFLYSQLPEDPAGRYDD